MDVLYLVHRIPFPPNKGDKIRSYRWLEHLASRHRVHLVALRDDPTDAEYEGNVAEFCASCSVTPISRPLARMGSFLRIPDGRPLSLNYFHRRDVQKVVDDILERESIDVILCFSAPMARYVEHVKGIPRVMDMVDVDSAKFASYREHLGRATRWVYGLEASRLSRFEESLVREMDSVILCTEHEAKLLRDREDGGRIEVVGNGVRLPEEQPDSGPRRPDFLFIGSMDYHANVDAVTFAAHEIMPLVLQEIPDAVFRIVGRNPAAEVRALDGLPGVVVHGEEDSLVPHLQRARISLIPLRIAQGIQNKVLEAMAWSIPVVTSERVASSLGAREGDNILVGRDAASYAEILVNLSRDDDETLRIGREGHDFVRNNFTWSSAAGKLEGILQELVGASSAEGC